ncbi:hypothetical protein D3C81_1601090 [compost metagenome]
MVIRVFDIRLPITGSRPSRKVSTISVLVSGKCTSNIGNTTARKMPVKVVLSSEILICAKTILRNACTSRLKRSNSAAARGLRREMSGMRCKATMAPRIMPMSKVTNMCAMPLPTSCSSPRWLFSQSPMATLNSAALAGR